MTAPLRHPLVSERAAEAIAGKPFALSDRFTAEQWDAALFYARHGDASDLEHMLIEDEAQAAEDAAAFAYEMRTGKTWEPLAMTPVGLA